MAQPWNVAPTTARRVADDFDLSRDRVAILSNLQSTSNGGIFYFDDVRGNWHAYTPLTYDVVYDSVSGPTGSAVDGGLSPPTRELGIVIPLREVEMRGVFEDWSQPDCVGRFRSDHLSPLTGCMPSGDPVDSRWGCAPGACPDGEGPATVEGYALITELEQVYSPVLQATMCVAFPTLQVMQDAGWVSPKHTCRTSQWNPSDPVFGLPMGDWCAATNSAATADCHDAFRVKMFKTYQGFKVQAGATCPL